MKEKLFQINTPSLDEDSARELIVQLVQDFTNICVRTTIDTIIHLTPSYKELSRLIASLDLP